MRLRVLILDQQRQLFSQDQFDDAIHPTRESLRNLELGTVSYRVLQQHRGGLAMLVDYANGELSDADSSDAVISSGRRLPSQMFPVGC